MNDVFETPMPCECVSNRFRPLTYLASPYSYKHPNKEVVLKVQKARFTACTRAAAWLISEFGWNVFSPITHSHPLHVLYPGIRGDWPFWEKIDTEYLQISQRIAILTIPGWEKSAGVTAERKIAEKEGIEFFYVAPRGEGFVLTKDPQPVPPFEFSPETDL